MTVAATLSVSTASPTAEVVRDVARGGLAARTILGAGRSRAIAVWSAITSALPD